MLQEKIREDLDYLLQKLKQNHPNPFLNISSVDFVQELTEISKNSVDITILGMRLQKLISQLRDSHSLICLNEKILGNKCYPLRFKSFVDGTYLIKVNPKNKEFLGMRLKKINNIPIEEVKERVKTLISNENPVSYSYYFVNFLYEPRILNYFNIIETPSILYELEDEQGIVHILSVQPENIDTQLLNIKEEIKIIDETLYLKDIYWTKYFENIHTYYFQYNSCKVKKELPIEKIIEDIKEKDIKKLVVDLRNNKGGDSRVLEPFIAYLNDTNQKFHLFVLTSSDTFSSAIMNAIKLSKMKNCKIVGDTPHGSPTHFGETLSFILPNSKLDFQLSTKQFEYPPYKLGETLKIDVPMGETFKDYASGIDKLMKYVKNVLP